MRLARTIKAESLVALLIKFIEEDNGVLGGIHLISPPPPPLDVRGLKFFVLVASWSPLKGPMGPAPQKKKNVN